MSKARIPPALARKTAEKLSPKPDPFIDDPVGWTNHKCRRFVWSMQKRIMESVRDHRFTAVPACHGPGKSFSASAIGAWWLDVHPKNTAFLLTTASTDTQVKAILWRELARRRREAKIQGRITLDAKWYAGEKMVDEELIGLGRKPQDYDQDAFQGIHETYVLIIVDEACGVPKNLFDQLETLMTNEFARILAIGNPDDPASHFESICRPGSGWNVIRIPAWITPNFTGEYVPPELANKLVSPLWVAERAKKWGTTSPLYISKVNAEFPEISSDTLITPSMVRRAQERVLNPVGFGEYGWDIARYGGDEICGYLNRGGHARLVYSKYQQALTTTADDIHFHLNQHGANYVPAAIDVIGLGAGVYDILRGRDLNVVEFNGATSASDTRRFSNKRAEGFWNLRELFEGGLIDIDPDDEELAAQLMSIKWGITRGKGQIYIESKDDSRRRGLPSPNRADALMMACAGLRISRNIGETFVGSTLVDDLLTIEM